MARSSGRHEGFLKATIEIPDEVLREAKAQAALRREYDSPRDPITGTFDFGFIRAGTYALTRAINQAVIGVGTVSLSDDAPALSFDTTGNTSMERSKK